MSDTAEENPSRAQALASQLSSVKERVAALANGRNVGDWTSLPCLYKPQRPLAGAHADRLDSIGATRRRLQAEAGK